MKCESCKSEIRPADEFCRKCGRSVAREGFCTRCGSVVAPQDSFCRKCGEQRRGGPSGPPPAAASRHAGQAGRPHSPTVALLVAFIMPGAGQAYNGMPIRGLFLLFTTPLVLPWLYSLYDAHVTARRIVAEGGRFGKGGYVWIFLQTWLVFNVSLMVLLGATMQGWLR